MNEKWKWWIVPEGVDLPVFCKKNNGGVERMTQRSFVDGDKLLMFMSGKNYEGRFLKPYTTRETYFKFRSRKR